MMTMLRLLALLVLFALPLTRRTLAEDRPISFSRDIRPIFSGRCYACHGPDDANRKADLRLDVPEGVQDVIKSSAGKTSELVARITSTDPDLQMPPAAAKKPPLSAEEIALVKRWVAQGAKYDAHWAWQPPQKPAAPQVKDATWPANEIDKFLLAEIERQGLKPSPEADKRTLLRRLAFDVVGLPPTPEEVAAFEEDNSPQAYEKQVARLLNSPQFGERMALYWLDVVRYADTGGYHSDNHRDVYLYRDYVIDAFNNNKPFDQFTVEQLAGDLLPNATREQRIASGYNKLLQTTEEGGAQPKEYTAKYAADRVRNTASIWLAGTMGCCECHNHKFDPYTIKDFYSFAAFFADVQEAAVGRQAQTKLPTAEQEARLKEFDARIAMLKQALDTQTPELDAVLAKWSQKTLADLAAMPAAWNVAKPEKVESSGKQTLTVLDDLSVLASGENPAKDDYTIVLPLGKENVTGVRLEALTHDTLANKSLSRGNGNFVLTDVEFEYVAADGKSKKLKLANAEADFSQDNHPIANLLDGKPKTGWAVNGHQAAANRAAAFMLSEAVGGEGSKLVVRLRHQSQFPQHNIGRFRLATTTMPKPSLNGIGVPADVVDVLRVAAADRSPPQKEKLAAYYRSIAPELSAVRTELAKTEAERSAFEKAIPTSLVSVAVAPRTVRLLPRGNWLDDSGDIALPAAPSFLTKLSSTPEKRLSRLDLAKWIVAADNPLTARVFVNRLWKLTFGRGIVKTMEDFGTQGQWPTHPELLDWLARDFADNGWDVKRAFKQILMSRAYRQTSLISAELKEKDPTNELFSRQNRFRIEAEAVRDNALAVSGLLSKKMYGPSVKPYQPAGYWQYLNFPTREWKNDHGEDLYRRGLYTYWQRTFLHPMLAAFDAPSREECTVERPKSNTPQQALALLNDPTFVEAARALAAKVIASGGTEIKPRLDYAFRIVLQRTPRTEEVNVLTKLLEKHRAEYQAEAAAAEQLLKVGESPMPDSMAKADLAAWTSVCRVLLNLHETVTRN